MSASASERTAGLPLLSRPSHLHSDSREAWPTTEDASLSKPEAGDEVGNNFESLPGNDDDAKLLCCLFGDEDRNIDSKVVAGEGLPKGAKCLKAASTVAGDAPSAAGLATPPPPPPRWAEDSLSPRLAGPGVGPSGSDSGPAPSAFTKRAFIVRSWVLSFWISSSCRSVSLLRSLSSCVRDASVATARLACSISAANASASRARAAARSRSSTIWAALPLEAAAS